MWCRFLSTAYSSSISIRTWKSKDLALREQNSELVPRSSALLGGFLSRRTCRCKGKTLEWMIALQAARSVGLLCVFLVGSTAFVHTSAKTSFKPALRPSSLCHVPPNRFFAEQSSIFPCLGDRRALRRGPAATRISASSGSFGRAEGRLIVASATAAATNNIQLAISTFMGYGILVGSLFLQMPQIIKIISSRSALGISRLSR